MFAHGTPSRIDKCDALGDVIATQVSVAVAEHDENAMGVVRLHLAPIGVAYSHGPLVQRCATPFNKSFALHKKCGGLFSVFEVGN